MPVIEVEHLHKQYGDLVAVDDLSFTVERGEIFGILGPNGAGKTTAVEMHRGPAHPRRRHRPGARPGSPAGPGRAATAGRGPAPGERAAREAEGRGGAWTSTAPFYDRPADSRAAARRPGLADKRDTRYGKLSGGQKQRLSIALALVGNPELAVLDELTTGLDPQARRDTWELIEQIRDRGVTVVLVTHFMEEAERLCDRVALHRRAAGWSPSTAPAGLVSRIDAEQRLRFRPSAPLDDAAAHRPAGGARGDPAGAPGVGDRHRQPAPGRHCGPGPQPDRRRRAADRAGQPGRRLRRADRPPPGQPTTSKTT